VETELVGDLGGVHGVGQILRVSAIPGLIGTSEESGKRELGYAPATVLKVEPRCRQCLGRLRPSKRHLGWRRLAPIGFRYSQQHTVACFSMKESPVTEKA
jgi:hypothetical protein